MASRFIAPAALLTLFLACAVGENARVTPVEKVVELLQKLQLQVEQEGKDEAAAYDKYACFCKEQADNKLYAIEKSTAKVAKLSAKIAQLGSEIADLDSDIGGLGEKITGLGGDMSRARAARDSEHGVFLTNQADAGGAVDACERALAALKESKAGMGGKTELEGAALTQVGSLAAVALGLASRTAFSEKELGQLGALARVGQPGNAYEYKYHANDIIATIESLRLKFKQNKLELEQEEFEANAAFETKQLAMANEKKFAEKEKMEKEALAEERREEKATTEDDKAEETNDKNADQNFLNVALSDCETKAHLWDQRSSTRSSELTAIAEAIEALKSGVAPNFKANKKLVGLQQRAAAAPAAGASAAGRAGRPGAAARGGQASPPRAAASFLQLRGGSLRGAGRGATSEREALLLAERARAVLTSAAEELGSPLLSAAALKVRVAEDHFAKVRQIIKDLLARLSADADAEASLKTFCDGAMGAAVEKRDKQQSLAEDYIAQISGKEAQKAQLQEEIAQLSEQIAQNKKALKEATELRQKEHEENDKTISEANAGKDAVDQALQVLKQFYEGHAFLQRASYVPTNSDREQLTVADRAPEIFDSEYKGSQEASKGIIGILEVVFSDFDRTIETVTDAETSAEADFQNFKTTIEDDTTTKEASVKAKDSEIAGIEDDLVALSDKKAAAQKDHGSSLDELKELQSTCVEGEETYEERVSKRQKEIAALKEAHAILENWQG